ncbi:glutaredoxin domain-containing cysteine-rich protein CG31559 [Hydra vulgaris]|uniref:Glutaredoxin domain-containing cysteine-rich protein 1 n=1 Tax=Hydra vulgaris TaxID=6087 RepID=T2MJY3_HYDVU|nr:glutaredoxin domain-containing cysteine-rich protein CG31559 [Hydra vulgaris]
MSYESLDNQFNEIERNEHNITRTVQPRYCNDQTIQNLYEDGDIMQDYEIENNSTSKINKLNQYDDNINDTFKTSDISDNNYNNCNDTELGEFNFYYYKADLLGHELENEETNNNKPEESCLACTLSEIRSDFGTVRGLQSKVAMIVKQFNNNKTNSNFLHTCDIGLSPEYKKVIIYTTSLGVIRKTKSECLYVRQVFRILMVKTEERDICCQENRKIFEKQFKGLTPPQVVIKGEYVGGRDRIEALLETGQIYNLIRYIDKVEYNRQSCKNCAGLYYINCPHCLGSRCSKYLRFTRKLFRLNCTFCTDGLIRCLECLDMLS